MSLGLKLLWDFADIFQYFLVVEAIDIDHRAVKRYKGGRLGWGNET